MAQTSRTPGPAGVFAGYTALAQDRVRRDRTDGIDLLRAVFALWVVLTHLTMWTVTAQGVGSAPAWLAAAMNALADAFQRHGELHPAVLGFIVLSGYCIHRVGLRAPQDGAVASYALKRCFRILPLYYIGIAAGLAGVAIANARAPAVAPSLHATGQIETVCVAAKALALAAFFPQLYPCGYLGNAPLATVMVEIVLYVVYAAAFGALIWRGRERLVWLVCAVVYLAALGLFAHGVDPLIYNWWQNGSLWGFLPYWWLGVLFVNPNFAAAARRRLWVAVAAWIGFTVLLTAFEPPLALALAELRKLCFAFGVGVLIVAIDDPRVRGAGLLAPIGRAGYGIYALHAPLTYTLAVYAVPWWANLLANIGLGLGVHQVIERPMIEIGRSLRYRLEGRPAAIRGGR